MNTADLLNPLLQRRHKKDHDLLTRTLGVAAASAVIGGTAAFFTKTERGRDLRKRLMAIFEKNGSGAKAVEQVKKAVESTFDFDLDEIIPSPAMAHAGARTSSRKTHKSSSSTKAHKTASKARASRSKA